MVSLLIRYLHGQRYYVFLAGANHRRSQSRLHSVGRMDSCLSEYIRRAPDDGKVRVRRSEITPLRILLPAYFQLTLPGSFGTAG